MGSLDQGEVTSASELQDEELLSNPRVKNLFNKFWEEKMTEMTASNKQGKDCKKTACRENVGKIINGGQLVKSPSDTTIYAPVLSKEMQTHKQLQTIDEQTCQQVLSSSPLRRLNDNIDLPATDINHIVLNFVDTMRLEHDSSVDLQEKERRKASDGNQNQDLQAARDRATKAIVEAEKFKATIAQPGSSDLYSGVQNDFLTNVQQPIGFAETTTIGNAGNA